MGMGRETAEEETTVLAAEMDEIESRKDEAGGVPRSI